MGFEETEKDLKEGAGQARPKTNEAEKREKGKLTLM